MALQRLPKSAAEIAHCSGLDGGALDVHLREHGAGLAPETLVHLMRCACFAGAQERFERCAQMLLGQSGEDGSFVGGHCEPLIRRMAAHFSLTEDPDVTNDFRAACHAMMWQAILAGVTVKPFWEERFFRALKGVCLDVGRSMLEGRRRLVRFSEDGEDAASEQIVDGSTEDIVLSGIDESTLRQVMRDLPPKVGRVAWLSWVEGFQASSKDSSEVTVASTLGISDRMVRKHLTRARELITQHPFVQAQRHDMRL